MSSSSVKSESDTIHNIKGDPLLSSGGRMEETSRSPSSSPPPPSREAPEEVQSPSRKRSHEEMNVESEQPIASSATVVGNTDQLDKASQDFQKTSYPSSVSMASDSSHSMPPPKAPASAMLPPSQKTPHSGQESQPSRQTQSRPLNSQPTNDANHANGRRNSRSNADDFVDDINEASSPASPPDEKIDDFDWHDLEVRYHHEMDRLYETEQHIMNSFNNLCRYFSIWAYAGTTQEVERSYKRLKTQMTLVEHHEDELEKKRLHYVKVVEAFQMVKSMLAETDHAVILRPFTKPPTMSATKTDNVHRTLSTDPHLTAGVLDENVRPIVSSVDVHPARCVVM